MAQYSDTTYSVVKGLGVDTENNELGLIIEGEGGADTLFPFKKGSPVTFATAHYDGYGRTGSLIYYRATDGTIKSHSCPRTMSYPTDMAIGTVTSGYDNSCSIQLAEDGYYFYATGYGGGAELRYCTAGTVVALNNYFSYSYIIKMDS